MGQSSCVLCGVPDFFQNGGETGGVQIFWKRLESRVKEEFNPDNFLTDAVMKLGGNAKALQFAGLQYFALEGFAFGNINDSHQNLGDVSGGERAGVQLDADCFLGAWDSARSPRGWFGDFKPAGGGIQTCAEGLEMKMERVLMLRADKALQP